MVLFAGSLYNTAIMATVVINHVQRFRTDKKRTQEELGLAVNVTRQTIIAIEKGHYTPSVSLALKLAHFFKTSVERMFSVEEKI